MSTERGKRLDRSSQVLRISNLHTSYGATHVLQGLDFGVAPGEIVGLFGANGSGKSTAVKSLMGIVPPSDGEIVINGKRCDGLPSWVIAEQGVGYLPQEEIGFARLTVRENLELAGTLMRPDRRRQEIDRLSGEFAVIEERWNEPFLHLSGGERAQVGIAMALLVPSPVLLLLDEPFAGLSPGITIKMLELVRSIVQKSGVGVLLVEQNVAAAMRVIDTGYVLSLGKIVRRLRPREEVIALEELWEVY